MQIQQDSHQPFGAAESAALWLCQLPGMSVDLARRLLAEHGSPQDVLRISAARLREIGVPSGLVARIVAGSRDVPRVAAGIGGLRRLNITPLAFASPQYPERLRETRAPPLVIYVQGAWPIDAPLLLTLGTLEAESLAAWHDLAPQLGPQIGVALIDRVLAEDSITPRLVGLPYGMLLSRQRLPKPLLASVAAGTTTLLSIAPPNAQTAAEADLVTTIGGLSDATLILPPLDDGVLAAARSSGSRLLALDGDVPNVRRIRANQRGLRMLRSALSLHVAGSETARQERLL